MQKRNNEKLEQPNQKSIKSLEVKKKQPTNSWEY